MAMHSLRKHLYIKNGYRDVMLLALKVRVGGDKARNVGGLLKLE